MTHWRAFELYTIDTIPAEHRRGAERQAATMWGDQVVEVRARLTGPYTLSGRYDVMGERLIGQLEARDLVHATTAARFAWGDRVSRVQSRLSIDAAKTEYHPRHETRDTEDDS